jgi:tRNA(Ile)-lysidine synthase
MPLLKTRFPAAAETLARSAALCAEAAALLAQSAAADIAQVQEEGSSLSVSRLHALGEVRARNLLHHWIHERGLPTPNAVHLQRLWHDVVCSAPDSEPRVAWPGAEARRYRDRVFVDRPQAPLDANLHLQWEATSPLTIAGLGVLALAPVQGQGIRASLLRGRRIEVRLRQGGEQLRPAGRDGHHALKKLFQEAGIPPWRRERIPLLYLDAELIAVAGLWVAQEAACRADEDGLLPEWSAQES